MTTTMLPALKKFLRSNASARIFQPCRVRNIDTLTMLAERNIVRLAHACNRMGTKWCLHPANRVARLTTPLI